MRCRVWPCTNVRSPTLAVSTAFWSVAGSNTSHSCEVPAFRPSRARRRPRLSTSTARDLREVAKIIYGVHTGQPGVAARFFQVDNGGYDTHANQTGTHNNLMRQLGATLYNISDDEHPVDDNTPLTGVTGGRAFVGDEIDLTLTIENKKPLPVPWMDLSVELPDGIEPEVREAGVRATTVSAGLHHVNAFAWSPSGDLIGLVGLVRGRRVERGGRAIQLTSKEYSLLEYLARRQSEVVGRADIAEHVWDEAYEARSNTIDVIVARLRRKIESDGRLIHTVPGVGYVLRPEAREQP